MGQDEEDPDEALNRLYGVDHAEYVRPSDAEPAKPPQQCEVCGSPDVQRAGKLRGYALFLALLFAIGVAVDQLMAAFLIALAGSIFFLIAPTWRCGTCGYRW